VGLATRYYFLSECYCLKFAVLYLWGDLSDERTDLQAICSVITQWSESLRTRNHTLLSSEAPPNLEDQVPVFISPWNRVAQLHPRALGYILPLTTNSVSHAHRPHRKHIARRFLYCSVSIRCSGRFTEPLHNNDCIFWLSEANENTETHRQHNYLPSMI
jgi:hypothetical protein